MRSRLLAACFTLGVLLLLLLQAQPVFAQGGGESAEPELALNRFEPAFAGDRMFGVQSAYTPGNPLFHVAVLGDYAHNPLVLRSDSDDESLGSIVSNQLFLHLNGTLSLLDRISVNVDAPLAVFQEGQEPEGGGQSYQAPDEVQFGDLRAGLRVRLFGEYFDPFQISIGGYMWFPTGPSNSFVSDKEVRGQPNLILGGYIADTVVWSLLVGSEFRPKTEIASTTQGSMLKWGAGVGVLLGDTERLQLALETSGGLVYEQIDSSTVNSELLADVRYRVLEDLELGVGAGPGLSSGVGTPEIRAVAMIAYTPMQHKPVEKPRDRDADGIIDAVDACPDQPGVANEDPQKNGCPLDDRDGDGIVDGDDACPDEPGVANEDPKLNGCPPVADRDADGIADGDDACPDEPGAADADPKKNGCPDRDGDGISDKLDACPDLKGVPSDDAALNGCPPDTDKDGFRDDQDACPLEKGVDDPDPEKRGCPKMVRVTDKEIVILQQVLFDTGKATIKQESFALIDEVAGVIVDHPEILKLRVEGHTDSRGAKAFNMRLSQARAESVMKALIERGTPAERLSAEGFGPNEPIGDNKTEEGRQKNRRVQFTILEKKPTPSAPSSGDDAAEPPMESGGP